MRNRRWNLKNPGGGRRRVRRRRGSKAAAGNSGDDGDKEYVAGEDEEEYDDDEGEEEEFDEDDDEEEFHFSDSSSGDGCCGSDEEEADFDDDGGEEEVDLFDVSRSMRSRSAVNSTRCARKSRVFGRRKEQDAVDLPVEIPRSKPRRVASSSTRSVRKPRVWVGRIEVEEVDDDFVELPISTRKSSAAVSKRSSRKFAFSDDEYYEDDDDLKRKKKNNRIRSWKDEGEDYEEDQDCDGDSKREKRNGIRSRKDEDDDYEEDQDCDGDSKREKRNGVRSWKDEDDDYEEDQDYDDDSKRKKRHGIRSQMDEDDDYKYHDEEEEDQDYHDDSKRKKRHGIRSQMDEDEDYEDQEEEEEGKDDEDDDEDFTLDEVDESEGLAKKHDKKGYGEKRKKSAGSHQKNVMKRRKVRYDKDYDDAFIVRDDSSTARKNKNNINKKAKNNKKRSLTSKATIKKSPAVDSETSDFDYMTSDDDYEVNNWNMVDQQRNTAKKDKRTNTAELGGRRSMRTSLGSNTSSSDSHLEISEEELRDLGIVGILNRRQPKRVFAETKGEEKGKEKISDEAGKQVCGICLSDEQRTTVQGILNCCVHYFCFACIMEWSKVESRCPLCKRRFGTITKSSSSYPGFGLRKSAIKVEKRDQVYQPSEEEIHRILDPYENVVCMECQQGGDDSLMLLCDICDSSAHTYCVGLGREVPEGNWYCECCRSVADISSHQASISDHGPSNATFLSHGMETEENKREAYAATTPQQTLPSAGQPSIREFDLNASPRPEEGYGNMSQASGVVAATLSGRRAIRHHIRLRFFSTRLSQTSAANDLLHHNAESWNITSGLERGDQSLHGLLSAQHHYRSSFQSNSNLAPCTSQESSFRCVEGAKVQVHSIVKHLLEDLSIGSQLEYSTFKKIARRSTHTVLAACGIKHKKKLVAGSFLPPSSCSHFMENVSSSLMQGCCSSCFSTFVGDVVSDVLHKIS